MRWQKGVNLEEKRSGRNKFRSPSEGGVWHESPFPYLIGQTAWSAELSGDSSE